MRLFKLWTEARDSLWFMPTLWVLGLGALAFALVAFDRAVPELSTEYPLIFGGGAEGARGLLSSIAGSMITVAGVTFSITIVALQLASSQFSPRVLRNFMRDRPSQIVLGSFIGTFTYSILVLRTVRGEESDAEAFIPAVSVTVAILLSLVALGMLVWFIHHIATRIQVTTVVGTIAHDTVGRIEDEWTEVPSGEAADQREPEGQPGVIRARDSGRLQLMDIEQMVELAAELELVVRLEVTPGDWVQEHAPLFSVWPAAAVTETIGERLNGAITVGGERSVQQDAAFGIRQLVDVALKAISTGVNDPTTATDSIDRLTQVLVTAGRRFPPPARRADDDGQLRVIIPYRSFDSLVGLAFDQLRQYAEGNLDVLLAVARALRRIASAVPTERHAPLRHQLALLRDSAERLPVATDRLRLLEAVAAAEDEAG